MAKARSIGSIYAELTVRDKMSKEIKAASKAFDTFEKSVAGFATGVAMALPAAAFAGLAASMKSAIDAGGQLADMMARTGASGEQLFILQRAFENAGIAGEKVPSVLNRMQKALADLDNSGTFASIGLDIRKLAADDPAESFMAIGRAISELPTPTERAAMAMKIFGKAGGELLVVMNDGQAFANAAKQVGGLGKTLGDNAARLDQISDAMGLLGVKSQQIGAEVAVELLPALEKLAAALEQMDLGDETKMMIDFAKAIGDAAGFAADLSKNLPGVKTASAVFDGVMGVAGMTGSISGGQGQALPVPDGWYGSNPLAAEDPLSSYVDGIMLPKFDTALSDFIKRRPDLITADAGVGGRLETAGIPGMGDLLDLMEGIKFGEDLFDEEKKRKPDMPDAESMANEYQRRGLSLDANGGQATLMKTLKDDVSTIAKLLVKNFRITREPVF